MFAACCLFFSLMLWVALKSLHSKPHKIQVKAFEFAISESSLGYLYPLGTSHATFSFLYSHPCISSISKFIRSNLGFSSSRHNRSVSARDLVKSLSRE